MDGKNPTRYDLPQISYLRLRVELRSLGKATLPPYKGSLLRGALGHSLRRAVCAMDRDTVCRSCPVGLACVYTSLFETFVDGGPRPFAGGLPASPHPYVVEPEGATRHYEPDDPLRFDLLLLGQAAGLQSFVVMALDRMAHHGLGARRHPFRLESVGYQDQNGIFRLGYQRGRSRWPGRVEPVVPARNGLDSKRVKIVFSTPTRIKAAGQLVREPDFRTLAHRMMRRTLEIAHFHVPNQAVDWDIDALLEQTEAVEIVESRLRWQDWQRYSNRQGRKMKLGGFMGEMVLEGDLEPFAPLLRTAEVIHVGKGATFGLGRLELQAA